MLPYIKEIRKTAKFNSKRALKSLFQNRVKPPIFEGAHELLIRKEFKNLRFS